MGTVALVFAPLAPLVALAGAIVFWMSTWVYKYQLMFVFITKVESGGVSSPYIVYNVRQDSKCSSVSGTWWSTEYSFLSF